MEDKPGLFRQCIQQVYPHLAITSLRLVGHGQNNDIVVVNEDLIFRFPRYAEGIKQLEVETSILRGIQPYVPLAVPNPVYVELEVKEPGQAFMGYRVLPGQPLRAEMLDAIPEEESVQAIATQVAVFLRCLHRIPIDEVLPDENSTHPPSQWEDMYARIRHKLFPAMKPDARRWTSDHFERFLHDPRSREIQPVLVHGDFGSGNILFDVESRAVTGVIDFGSAHLDDPAVDFAAASTIAPSFLQQFHDVYPEVELAMDRVQFYRGTFALQEALFGAENGDDDALRAGLRDFI